MVFGFRSDEQPQTEQSENVNQCGKQHRRDAAVDRHIEEETHDDEKNQRHRHANAEIRHKFAQHQSPTAEGTHQQLLQRTALALAHHSHGGGKGSADLQNDSDHARNVKVRAAHRRVVEHLRADIDRDVVPAGFTQQRLE